MHGNGRGTEQSFEKAAECFRKAAEAGDPASQYNLGHMYEAGSGVEQSFEKAAGWYRKAAEQGFADAMVCLGRMCEGGIVVGKSLDEAIGWYRKAAEQGSAPAEELLRALEERLPEERWPFADPPSFPSIFCCASRKHLCGIPPGLRKERLDVLAAERKQRFKDYLRNEAEIEGADPPGASTAVRIPRHDVPLDSAGHPLQ